MVRSKYLAKLCEETRLLCACKRAQLPEGMPCLDRETSTSGQKGGCAQPWAPQVVGTVGRAGRQPVVVEGREERADRHVAPGPKETQATAAKSADPTYTPISSLILKRSYPLIFTIGHHGQGKKEMGLMKPLCLCVVK